MSFTKKFIDCQEADQKKLAYLEKRFRDVEPQWSALQSQAETIEARRDSQNGTYSPNVSETFWSEHSQRLTHQLEEVIVQRDRLTIEISRGIADLKGTLHRRHIIFTGKFLSWASTIIGLLPPGSDLAADLTKARSAMSEMSGTSQAVSIATRAAEKVEATGDPGLPLFRIEDAARLACEKN